ncbi:MAG TPA: hypothetical protein VLG76_01280 [Rhabdochlamydiaceae bacterium]|nr:hypothetical protein [Rhabdochlamydiaceae bacterium]
MKKFLLVFLVFGFSLFGSIEVSEPLLQLLDATHVQHDGTAESILQETQKKWLRPKGKERWQIPDVDEKTKEQILLLADQLGFVSEISPQAKEYEYAAVLGATYERMEKRLDYLIQLWNRGIRFKHVVFLTGQRPLDVSIEPISEECKNESQAARQIWKTSLVPQEMRDLPVTFIEVPMKPDGKRPTTKDTYEAWLARKPAAGRTLLVSNQPFCLYQEALAKSFLPKGFQVEVVGAAMEERQNGAVMLDAIAGWIFYSRNL